MFEFVKEIANNIIQWFQALTLFEWCAIALIIGLTILYIFKNTRSENDDYLLKMTSLNKKTDIITADIVQSKLLGTSGSTVMGFFNLHQGNRTMASTQTIKQNDGTTLQIDDYQQLLYVANNWWLEVAHGASTSAARLRIHTTNGGKNTMEIVELPPIPRQRWVFIAILRDGRRFDVIYDNRIVASKRLMSYPVIISSPLAVGNPTLLGKVIHVIINPTRLSPSDVERQRLIYVDTNNDVLEDNDLLISLPTFTLAAGCLPGLPCDNITHPPNNVLKWKTPYA
jgi:hypothetical protein